MKLIHKHMIKYLFLASLLLQVINYSGIYGSEVEKIEYANELNKLGVLLGSEKGYELDRIPTRLEGLVLLIRLLGLEDEISNCEVSTMAFADVPEWGKHYVNYAYANGLASGIRSDYFGANDQLRLNDYMTFALRALGYNDKNGDFTWGNSVQFGQKVGIISSYDKEQLLSGSFDRGEVVHVSYQTLHTKMKNSSVNLLGYLENKGALQDYNYEEIINILEASTYPGIDYSFDWINLFATKITYVESINYGINTPLNVKNVGAIGNGVNNDTAAIQQALNQSNYVYIPDGVYMIDAVTGLRPKSNQRIVMSEGAVLKVIPNNRQAYAVFSIENVENLEINGGTLLGDRYTHIGSGSVWSNGIYISGDSKGIILSNIICSDFIGNGIKIEGSTNNVCSDILILGGNYHDNTDSGITVEGILGPVKRLIIRETYFISNYQGLYLNTCEDILVDGSVIQESDDAGLTLFKDVENSAFYEVDVNGNSKMGVSIVTAYQRGNTEAVLFLNSNFENNSRGSHNYDGVRIDSYDNLGYVKDIYFKNCSFIDTQNSKTQRYGLSVSKSEKVRNIVISADCFFNGNVEKGIFGEYPQLVIEQSTGIVDVTTTGAVGDGVTDDTLAIQRALNISDEVYFPDGMYMVDAAVSLFPKSNQTITLSENAIIKAIPNNLEYYNIIYIDNVSNVIIQGGKIYGERYDHLGSTGEWGSGISIISSAENIQIKDIIIKECWGDGIYIGGNEFMKNIYITNVVSDDNRRQGMSVTGGQYIYISDSQFINTNGIEPGAGIDIEPNSGNSCKYIWIENSLIQNNQGNGINIMGELGEISNISIEGCTSKNNEYGVRMDKCEDIVIMDSTFSDNYFNGLEVVRDTAHALFDNNKYTNNGQHGVALVVTNQVMGTYDIEFRNSQFMDNGTRSYNQFDGIRVDHYDGTMTLEDIRFYNCIFGSYDVSTTQRYGLSIGSINDGKIYVNRKCYFTGNVKGGLKDPHGNSAFVE